MSLKRCAVLTLNKGRDEGVPNTETSSLGNYSSEWAWHAAKQLRRLEVRDFRETDLD